MLLFKRLFNNFVKHFLILNLTKSKLFLTTINWTTLILQIFGKYEVAIIAKFELVDSNNTKFSFKVVVKHTILELCIILDSLPSSPDVIYLQETWTSKENEFLLITLHGSKLVTCFSRTQKCSGGTAFL